MTTIIFKKGEAMRNYYFKMDYIVRTILVISFLTFPLISHSAQDINIGSGSKAGTYYPFAVGIAGVLNKHLKNVKAVAHSTGGSAYNNERILAKTMEMAMMQNDVAFYAYENLEKVAHNRRLRAIGTLYSEDIHIVVRKDSGIKTLNDMVDKRIAIGNEGSGQLRNSRQILESVGIYNRIIKDYSKFKEAVELLKHKKIDGLFYTVGYPAKGLTTLTKKVDCRFIALDNSTINQMLSDFPFYVKSHIPEGTYKGLNNNINTVAVKASLVVREDLPGSLVYAMTKVIFENLDDLKTTHTKWAQVSQMKSRLGIGIPFHPGADEYFKKQVIEVRKKPFSMSPVIGYVNSGANLKIYTDKWNMYKIQTFTGEKGWIRQGEITDVKKSTIPGYRVKAKSYNFRSGPSLTDRPIRLLQQGDVFEKIGEQHNRKDSILWYKVRLENGDTGWVSSNRRYVERYHHTGRQGFARSGGGKSGEFERQAKAKWLK